MKLKKAVYISSTAVILSIGITALWLMVHTPTTTRSIQLSDSVVAVIGDRYITLSELQQAFETAHPVLKKGNSDRERLQSVLAAMLAEKILSNEASRLGLQNNQRIEQLHNEFQRKAIIEQVIVADVDSRINVTTDEANEETMKSLVSFKFRYWMEPTYERAERVRTLMQKNGYADVVQQLVKQNPELSGIARQLESDYLRWTEIESQFYNAIKDLPVGEISDPVEYDGAFYLLQLVDIRRSGMTTATLSNSIPTSKKIIYARKRTAARKAYVAALMEPKKVTTNSISLKILVQAVGEWYSSSRHNTVDFFSAAERADDSSPTLQLYKKEQSRTLVTTIDKQFSIAEIARVLPLRKIMKEHQNVFAALAAYTAASVRDHYLELIGAEREYQNDPVSRENLRVWRDKWLYEEYRLQFTLMNNPIGNEAAELGVRQFIVKKDQQFLLQKIDSLVAQFPVQIHKSVLDTVQISDPIRSRYMPMSFVRGGTDMPAFPTVGNEWQNEISELKQLLTLQKNTMK